jgi:hypothetical protein
MMIIFSHDHRDDDESVRVGGRRGEDPRTHRRDPPLDRGLTLHRDGVSCLTQVKTSSWSVRGSSSSTSPPSQRWRWTVVLTTVTTSHDHRNGDEGVGLGERRRESSRTHRRGPPLDGGLRLHRDGVSCLTQVQLRPLRSEIFLLHLPTQSALVLGDGVDDNHHSGPPYDDEGIEVEERRGGGSSNAPALMPHLTEG